MRDPNSTSRHVIVRDIPDGEDAYGDDGKARGEIVSYAMWNFFVTPEEEGTAVEGVGGDRRRDGGGVYYESWPPDAHHEALKALVETGRKKREDTMGNKRYACKYISLFIYVSTLRSLIAIKRNVSHVLVRSLLSLIFQLAACHLSCLLYQSIVLYLPTYTLPRSGVHYPYHAHLFHPSPRIHLHLHHPPSNGRSFQIDRLWPCTRRRPSTSHIRRIDTKCPTSVP